MFDFFLVLTAVLAALKLAAVGGAAAVSWWWVVGLAFVPTAFALVALAAVYVVILLDKARQRRSRAQRQLRLVPR